MDATDEDANLEYLINEARKINMSSEERAEQRASFAYGNAAFENHLITREMVKKQAAKIDTYE